MKRLVFAVFMILTGLFLYAGLSSGAHSGKALAGVRGAPGEPQWGADYRVNPPLQMTPAADRNY